MYISVIKIKYLFIFSILKNSGFSIFKNINVNNKHLHKLSIYFKKFNNFFSTMNFFI